MISVLADISNKQNLQSLPVTNNNVTAIDLSRADNNDQLNSSFILQNADGSYCEVVDISSELLTTNSETLQSAAIDCNSGKVVTQISII